MNEYNPGLHFANEYADKWLEENSKNLKSLETVINESIKDIINQIAFRTVTEMMRDAAIDGFLAGIKNITEELHEKT